MEKISLKPHFFRWVSDFLYELSYLIHCNHVVDVFPLIIVIVTSRNTISFVLMKKKKTLNVRRNILHYIEILHNELFNEITGTEGSISDWVSEKFHFVTTWRFSRKKVSNCDYYPQFWKHEKLNICIVCYIINHQNSWIFKFMLHHLQS